MLLTLEREQDDEAASSSGVVLHPDRTAVRLHDGAGDRKAKPDAFPRHSSCFAGLLKLLEYLPLQAVGNPGAAVCNRYHSVLAAAGPRERRHSIQELGYRTCHHLDRRSAR